MKGDGDTFARGVGGAVVLQLLSVLGTATTDELIAMAQKTTNGRISMNRNQLRAWLRRMVGQGLVRSTPMPGEHPGHPRYRHELTSDGRLQAIVDAEDFGRIFSAAAVSRAG